MLDGSNIPLILRGIVIVLFFVINVQLAYYYLITRFPEYLILFFRFLSGIIILYLVNFLETAVLTRIFYFLFIGIYALLLLFGMRLKKDILDYALHLFFSILILIIPFWKQIPISSDYSTFPMIQMSFITIDADIGIIVAGTLISAKYPWPYVLFRLMVDIQLIQKFIRIDTKERNAKYSWIGYLFLYAMFDLMFFFAPMVLRLSVLALTNMYFAVMVWKRPQWVFLTKSQLISLHDKVLRVVSEHKKINIPVPLTNTVDLHVYLTKVAEMLQMKQDSPEQRASIAHKD